MKSSKGKAMVRLALLLVLIAIAGFFGYSYMDDIKLGLDLAGGVSITYQAKEENPSAEDMSDTIYKLQQRVESYSTEAEVYQEGDNRINIDIPGESDANEILTELGKPGSLAFMDSQGNTILTGDQVASAQGGMVDGNTGKEYVVSLTFTEEGTKAFADATTNNVGKPIYIVYDNEVVSAPVVREAITGGQCTIDGMSDFEEAENLAATIRIGSLSLELEELRSNVVGAKLGQQAITTSLKAGAVGFAIVAVFMIAVYLIPGLAAVLALSLYVGLILILLVSFEVTLTLPGVAGIILSIGMAVDANVIIFERIKEEMAAGKTVKSAIDSGFKRAFTAILDSNITTLIACGVLFFLGTGTIVGFATTLGIGVIVSMFTALTITHFLLRRMVDFHIRNPKAYGLRERKEEKKHFPILKNFKIFSGISVVLIVTGLVALILLPFGKNLFNLSIDFAGGTEMEFNMHTAVTQDIQTEVSDLFKDATGVDASSVTSSGDGNEDVLIRSTSIDSEQRAAVIDKMLKQYSLADTDILNNNDVSASVGSDLQRSAFICSILAILLMLVYITFRFELTSGLAAICCLVHDLLVMLSVYVLLQIPLDSNFIAAALTILGYSINASIIVFDRVRENLRTARKEPFEVIGEKSIWQTMGRTINTTLTTLFTIGMVYILGVPSLKQFTLPLIVGILAGGWSSVMLSTGLWGFFRKKFRRRRKI